MQTEAREKESAWRVVEAISIAASLLTLGSVQDSAVVLLLWKKTVPKSINSCRGVQWVQFEDEAFTSGNLKS